MPGKFESGRIDFSFSFGSGKPSARPDSDTPFRLVILGDFSGRASRSIRQSLEGRPVWSVDVDNLEQVLKRFEAALALQEPAQGEGPVNLAFESLDDFHPDQLLKRISRTARLIKLRDELAQPKTSAAAVAELQSVLQITAEAAAPTAPAAVPQPPAETNADMLSRLLGGTPIQATPQVSRPSGVPDLSGLMRDAAQASMVSSPGSQHAAYVSALDLALRLELRSVLHAPAFQQLEASWRGLDLLVRKFGGDDRVELAVVDCSRDELAGDPQGLARLVVRNSEQGAWGAWAGLFSFHATEADLTLLTQLTAIAAHVRAPFLGRAAPELAGCLGFERQPFPEEWKPLPETIRDLWETVRRLPEAPWLGLAAPRFLLRQPYGKGSDTIESFAFEELDPDPVHEHYLWGNPAILAAASIAEAFLESGWGIDLNSAGAMGELPVHRYRKDGETVMKPCAEAWLSDRAGEAMLARGLIPVLSVKNSDSVRIYKLCSLAAKPGLLAGRWA